MNRILASLLLAAAGAALAKGAVPVAIEGEWARSAVTGQGSSAAYMTLTAREPLTLVGAESAAAGIIEIHEMKMEGDVMKMRAADTLPLAPGKPLQLAPGGYHFMLMDLKTPFKAGSRIQLTLQFKDAKGKMKKVPVSVPVAARKPS